MALLIPKNAGSTGITGGPLGLTHQHLLVEVHHPPDYGYQ
jgi:hypothetical protein